MLWGLVEERHNAPSCKGLIAFHSALIWHKNGQAGPSLPHLPIRVEFLPPSLYPTVLSALAPIS